MRNQGLDSNFKRLDRTPPKFVKARLAKTQSKAMPKSESFLEQFEKANKEWKLSQKSTSFQ